MSIHSSHLSPAEALVRFEHFAGDVCGDYEGLSLTLRSVNRNELTGASLARGLHSFVILFRSAVDGNICNGQGRRKSRRAWFGDCSGSHCLSTKCL